MEHLNEKAKKFLHDDRVLLCLIKHGSHLYGTDTPSSDLDLKGVYLPSKEDFLMQRVQHSFHADSNNTGSKNTKDDVDIELFSLDQFVKLAVQGQTVALDMLHVNEENLLLSTDIWEELMEFRHKFYQKELKAFIGYAMKQAAKYGLKGSRLADIERVIAVMNAAVLNGDATDSSKLHEIWKDFPETENCFFMTKDTPQGEQRFYNMCGKLLQESVTIEYAYNIMKKFYDQYGDRAKQAKSNEGVDFKAMSHALRACFQLKEIYETRNLEFPLKDAEFLKDVKAGRLEYCTVANELEKQLEVVSELSRNSEFPERVDREFWESWLMETLFRRI